MLFITEIVNKKTKDAVKWLGTVRAITKKVDLPAFVSYKVGLAISSLTSRWKPRADRLPERLGESESLRLDLKVDSN